MEPPSSIFLPYPAVLTPRDRYVYFVPPESFNLAGMLSNPMMLLMVGGAGMMLAMPYLIVSPICLFTPTYMLNSFAEEYGSRSSGGI